MHTLRSSGIKGWFSRIGDALRGLFQSDNGVRVEERGVDDLGVILERWFRNGRQFSTDMVPPEPVIDDNYDNEALFVVGMENNHGN